jgi:PII-like signaling protein
VSDCLKLTTYVGERARADGGFLADALVAIAARHGLRTSIVLRGIAGFGAKHHLRTDRLLTLSEDLPLVAIAVDRRAAIEAALADVRALPRFSGLVALERAQLLAGDAVAAPDADASAVLAGPGAKLTVYVGRQERAGGRPAHEAVVDLLHARGVAGATVLLGVDGTVGGERRRARFFGRNAAVPLMVLAVGDGDRLAAALPELHTLLAAPLATLERVQVCKRDGVLLERPRALAGTDPSGLPVWQKLTVLGSERARVGDEPQHRALVAALRRAGARGATSVRGIWGYHGDHPPHGDRLLQLRRHVPVVTTIVDRPDAIQRWFDLVDGLTTQTGLVTSEMVPVLEDPAAGFARGG